jgi:hypothetical protein
MKVKVRLARTQGGWVVLCGPPRTPGASRSHCEKRRTKSVHAGTELCLVRTKSGETLMEVRSDSDVQIDRRNWQVSKSQVCERKSFKCRCENDGAL